MMNLDVLELQLVDAWIQENVCSLDGGIYHHAFLEAYNVMPKEGANVKCVYKVGKIEILVTYDEWDYPESIHVVGLTEWQRELNKKLF